jgi:hypothetical protein
LFFFKRLRELSPPKRAVNKGALAVFYGIAFVFFFGLWLRTLSAAFTNALAGRRK